MTLPDLKKNTSEDDILFLCLSPSASGKAVVEINAKTRLLKPNALAMKRTLPEDENMTTVGPEFKRQKIDELEKNKAQLLSVLWTFIFSHGFLYGVSQEVKKLQG